MPANHSSLPLDQHLSAGRQTRRVSPLSRRAIAFRPRPDRHSADSPPSSVIVAERSADFDGDAAIERAVSSMGDVERLSESEQFTKLRHFLEAVYQSASGDTEDAARKAIIGLVEGDLSPPDFFNDLQGRTRFPLKPLVVPFLNGALPVVRQRYQTTQQREQLFDDLFASINLKQTKLASSTTIDQDYFSRKRHILEQVVIADGSKRLRSDNKAPTLHGVKTAQELNLVSRPLQTSKPNSSTFNGLAGVPALEGGPWSWYTEEWRNMENLFTTLASSVERLRYSMMLFQQRVRLGQMWSEQLQQSRESTTHSAEEMQRKADMAVQQVKKVAVQELQNAVAMAEQKALAMVAAERLHMERTFQEAQKQEDCVQNCWNCGRRAGQACSGCSVARYCGSFCQHRDWTKHKPSCQQSESSPARTIDNVESLVKLEQPSPPNASSSPKSV